MVRPYSTKKATFLWVKNVIMVCYYGYYVIMVSYKKTCKEYWLKEIVISGGGHK